MSMFLHVRRYTVFVGLLGLFSFGALFPGSAGAQVDSTLELRFKRVDPSQYPLIRCYIQLRLGQRLRYDITKGNFTIFENGELMRIIRLTCPDPQEIDPISVALVLDRSWSMKSLGRMDSARSALHTFIDLLSCYPKGCDEAALISFARDATVDQPFTSDKAALHRAIDNVKFGSYTNVWDAVLLAVQLTAQRSSKLKAIIVLTDGEHNVVPIDAKKSAALSAARAAGIPIFTIGLQLRRPRARADLRELADATNGKFFDAVSPADLLEIYLKISEILNQDELDCILEYETYPCQDGTMRRVKIIADAFGRIDSAFQTYFAPADSGTYTSIGLRLPSMQVSGRDTFQVPVFLENFIPDTAFKGFDALVRFDRTKLELLGVSVAGTISEGLNVTTRDVPEGVRVSADGFLTPMPNSGILFNLRFTARDFPDDLQAVVSIGELTFRNRCLKPFPKDGIIDILSRRTAFSLVCSVPDSIHWDAGAGAFVPNPFQVSVNVTNTGPREFGHVRAILRLSTGATIEGTRSDTLELTPSILTRNQGGTAAWTVRVLPTAPDTLSGCVIVQTDRTPDDTCCFRIPAPRRGPVLNLLCSAPDTIFYTGDGYTPRPIPVSITVVNTGDTPAYPVNVSLSQTEFLRLGRQERSFKPVEPSRLNPGDTGRAVFFLRATGRLQPGVDTIRMVVTAQGYGPLHCERIVVIMPAFLPELAVTCTMPDTIRFNNITGKYEPDPFAFTARIVNTGSIPVTEVRAVFSYHAGLTLDSGETPVKAIPGGTLLPGGRADLAWMVRAVPHSQPSLDTGSVFVSGKGGIGEAFAECSATTNVGVQRLPVLSIRCSAPDSLQYVDSVYAPDPFRYTVTVTNTGSVPAFDVSGIVLLPPDILLARGEQTKQSAASNPLMPGASATFGWNLSPRDRASGGRVGICAQVSTRNLEATTCCDSVYIPPVSKAFLALECSSLDSVSADLDNNRYVPESFPVVARIRNTGNRTARNVSATLIPVQGVSVADPTTQRASPPDLGPGEETRITWTLRPRPRSSGGTLSFTLLVNSSDTRQTQCSLPVYVPALPASKLSLDCAAPDTIAFDHARGVYDPNPFTVSVRVRNLSVTTARAVAVSCAVGPGLALADGELQTKPVIPSVLATGEEGETSFEVYALRKDSTEERWIRFFGRAYNAPEVECRAATVVVGAPRTAVLSLPENVLIGYEQKVPVPVFIDNTAGKDITSFDIRLAFDPAAVGFVDAFTTGTLSDKWLNMRWRNAGEGLVDISASSSVPLQGSGPLLYITFEGRYAGEENTLSVKQTPVQFRRAELAEGQVRTTTVDGTITTTGVCLVPLQGGSALLQNRPNPFNPSTTIPFVITLPGHVTLKIYDRLGRLVAVPVDETLPAGKHTVTFTASGLPSGVYFYQLQTINETFTRPMILAR